MKRKNEVANSLVGLLCVSGLVGLFYLLLNENKKEKNKMKHAVGNGKLSNKTISQRESEALVNHIHAMTNEELEVVVQAIPVSLCMWRIQKALDHAAEFETMIRKAYEMKE